MKLGAAIKELRRESDLRQKKLAQRVGVSQSYLSQVENEHKDPNLSTIRRIAEEVGVSVPILFFLSMDSDDVRPDRKEAFDQIFPRFKGIIEDQLLAEA